MTIEPDCSMIPADTNPAFILLIIAKAEEVHGFLKTHTKIFTLPLPVSLHKRVKHLKQGTRQSQKQETPQQMIKKYIHYTPLLTERLKALSIGLNNNSPSSASLIITSASALPIFSTIILLNPIP